MDNEDRSKDVKDKMETCIKNTKRFLSKAPYWYKNITIKKWHKDIILDKKEAQIVKEIFELRLESKSFWKIALILKEKYWNSLNIRLEANRIQKIITKKFYYWVFEWNGQEIVWSHKPIISKETFDKANGFKWVFEIKKNQEKWTRLYHLKGFIKDASWINLCAYQKAGHTYYINQYRSNEKLNIREDIIFDKFWKYLKSCELDNKALQSIDRDLILDLLKKKKLENNENQIDYQKEIEKLKDKQEHLLDMRLWRFISIKK